ncbi:TPA: hypothetical protein DDZ86_05115 [Candidatus Dependentiae bacterium]|nr:MAG: hypothetical protein A2Y17_09920 [Clostridiales bacterium GWF2_38_85]HBL98992.1 hypothetical protein [Candidatus Dependentiae bacterium]
MIPTKLLYLEDNFCFTGFATILEVVLRDGIQAVVLDQTIFYPQGGGQPADHGEIVGPNGRFAVTDVRFVDGIVNHSGEYADGVLEAGNRVELFVDVKRREFLSKLHTAGHLIDVAMERLDLHLPSAKGYHFPDNPYVEYEGSFTSDECAALQPRLQQEVNRLVEENIPVTYRMAKREELDAICIHVPTYLPEGKPIRVVSIGTLATCPCGGTHVASSAEVGFIEIRKLKSKGLNLRVSYVLKGSSLG